jgi:hypothetical protein
VIARVLAKVIKSLGILEYGAGTLSESQEFIQFPFHEPFWNVMGSESILEFIPSDYMIVWEHGEIVVPPVHVLPPCPPRDTPEVVSL